MDWKRNASRTHQRKRFHIKGLSPILVDQVFDIIKQLRDDGTTILLVEQNAGKSLAISDRAYVLELGEIVLSGTGAELAASEEVKKAYLGG